MSAKKKATVIQSIHDVFAQISDALVEIKGILGTNPAAHDPNSVNLLDELAGYADSFSRARHKAKKLPAHMADTLDREGVNLWNISTFLKEDAEKRTLFASLRLAGFRLIEAGLESTPGTETLIHLLQLASKAGAALSACGRQESATNVLTCGAKYEESLRGLSDGTPVDVRAKASAVLTYYSGRMESAWKDSNENVAYFMLQQALDNHRVSRFTASDRDLLALKVLDIGKDILKSAATNKDSGVPASAPKENTLSDVDVGQRSVTAVKWLQHALQIMERRPESRDDGGDELGADAPGGMSRSHLIKRSILRSLARAYFISSEVDPDNLPRAEAALVELNSLIELQGEGQNIQHSNDELQQLRWMHFAVLKRRHAGPQEFVQAFSAIIGAMAFNEEAVMDIIQELATMSPTHRKAVVQITHICIQEAVNKKEAHEFVHRFMLSLLLQVKGDANASQALQDVEKACGIVAAHPSIILDKNASSACRSILWIVAEKFYSLKKWTQAAQWFLLSSSPAFRALPAAVNAKSLRKAALCYVYQGEYAHASSIVLRCPGNEAATHYLAVLAAAYQGSEGEAIAAVDHMIKAVDFDRRMLLMITQLAHENQLKQLLLNVLSALLLTLSSNSGVSNLVEGITLTRCIIRLITSLIKDPEADIPALAATLLRQFRTGLELVSKASGSKEAAVISKDLSWLWRTSYNCAVEGCTVWPSDSVVGLFAVTAEYITFMRRLSVTEDTELPLYQVLALYSAMTGRVFGMRLSSTQHDESRRQILADISSVQTLINEARKASTSPIIQERFSAVAHHCLLFQVEQLSALGEWNAIGALIKDIPNNSGGQVSETYEAISDALWVEEKCPTEVLFIALESMLQACLDKTDLQVDRFSRWLRAICTTLLSRNRSSDRIKALSYIEQAIEVIRERAAIDDGIDNGSQSYPPDEQRWLFTIAYNNGVECFGASLLDEAKRWFESASILSRLLNDQSLSAKVSETYKNLLNQYDTT